MMPVERAMVIERPRLQLPTAEAFPSEGIPVEEILIRACRALRRAPAGLELVADCDPIRLRVSANLAPIVERGALLLLESAIAAESSLAEIDLSATASTDPQEPLLFLSVRAIADRADRRREQVPLGLPAAPRIARIGVHPTTGTLLLSRHSPVETRFSLGLGLASRVPSRWPTRVLDPLEANALVAGENPRARRAWRRRLESEGLVVREAARPLELLLQLDPEETGGVPPSWLLLDGSWLDDGVRARRGIREVVEASMPASRVLLVGGDPAAGALGSEGWKELPRPFSGRELRASLQSVGAH